MAENQIIKNEIPFPNGNRAQSVTVSADEPIDAILSSLEIKQPKALILVLGGAAGLDESLKPRLLALFSRSIACAAIETGAVIIDGGTKAGVMELMGQAVADQGRKSILLGVAPSGKVTYPQGPADGSIKDGAPLDPDHSHFVLVESEEWGGETGMMFKVAKSLADKIPVVAILANGGDISRKEVLFNVRQGWPLIVIEGTGGLADDIVDILAEKKKTPFVQKIPILKKIKKPKKVCISENQMAEIIEDGDIHSFKLDCEPQRFKNLILGKLTMSNPTLKLAWERFALYDTNAIRQQKKFSSLQKSILALGVVATLLALSLTQLTLMNIIDPGSWQDNIFRNIIILVPITISILFAASNKFKEGNKWILLRYSAESIKRAIFCYRTHTETKPNNNDKKMSPEAKLAWDVESVSRQLMQTDVNLSGLKPYNGQIPPKMYGAAEKDDGFSSLSPEDYIKIRLGDQLNFYQGKTNQKEKQLQFWQWSIYILGGVGTFLAAIKLELWIALTTALAGAIIAFLEYQQVEYSLIKYNQTSTDLINIKAWWTALSPEEKLSTEEKGRENFNKLVTHTEKVLQSELGGWIQQMDNMLKGLKAKQDKSYNKADQTSKKGDQELE